MTTTKNLHLICSAVIIAVVSLVYGLSPAAMLPKLFDFSVESADLKQVFRATMGLYLAMVVLWAIGIFKPAYWRFATISNICFMMGLAAGRIIGIIADGMPSVYFLIGLALELVLGFWGIRNLIRYPFVVSK